MVNPLILIGMLVMMVLTVVGALYVLVYFQHEEDRNVAWAPKIVVLIGLSLASWVVLALPLDIANTKADGGLRIDVVWQILYTTIAVWCSAVIPFAIFYYEAEDPDSNRSQLVSALKWTFATVVAAVFVTFLLWGLLGQAEIPVAKYTLPSSALLSVDDLSYPLQCTGSQCGSSEALLTIGVTPSVYIMAMISFIGWFFFVVFGGIGIAALPLDLINAYANKPERISLQEFAQQKMLLNERAGKLLEIGRRFTAEGRHVRRTRANRRTYNRFKQAVYFLEKDWERCNVAYKQRGGNPLVYLASLVFGCLSAVLSTVWLLHVMIYVFPNPPAHPFLNNYFIALDRAFPLFGTMTYAIFAVYLLLCTIKGNIKFGLRVFIFQIHPMRVGATMMNSLLFNTELILLCAVAVVHFCAEAFDLYTRLTDINMLLGVQVENLRVLSAFFRNNVFLYVFTILSILSCMWLLTFPKEKKQENFDDDDD
eukprot:CAMPEP_0206000252 /NCGR_PEP_ID=MMETSP1464-20131121/1348_1 /ASSEMBLY_ACC=CAM_ASM_001124 /TAXON_ID=119497 /ORGANISM="Exanthemachrysis gayraliae, Strain RCC1523" /LENGTH=479 /DNA_ID=CAMNT_0053373505 /DNA_START=87 /DNA_END=1526 /DNA_ORIENTATION=-